MTVFSTNPVIELPNPHQTFLAIFGVLACAIIAFPIRAKKTFLDYDTNLSLRGGAVLLLLFGHLSAFCLKQKMFFGLGGYVAVILFLFASGYGLAARYGFDRLPLSFWHKRVRKIFVPLWLTLLLFIALDYVLLDRTHAWPVAIGNFLGYLRHGRSQISPAAWFVQYILVLYLLYFLISRMPFSESGKIAAILVASSALGLLVSAPPLRQYHGIWAGYCLAFPVGIITHRVMSREDSPARLMENSMVLGVVCCAGMAVFARWNNFFHLTPYNLANALRAVPLLCAVIAGLGLYEKLAFHSRPLLFLGKYSYEIFLVHFPFMVKYDFFLFRRPLSIWFLVYLAFVVVLSMLLRSASSRIEARLFGTGQQAPRQRPG